MNGEQERISTELDQARREHESQAGAPKHQRREAARKVSDLDQKLASIKRDLGGLESWSPPVTELTVERNAVTRARETRDKARAAAKEVLSEIHRLERLAREQFIFKSPPRLVAPAVPKEVPSPPVPDEAPPELGELFEHQGKRYLAVKTWEQVSKALLVAIRLKSTLVCLTVP